MKVIWCDDKSDNAADLESFADEWFLDEGTEILTAKDDDQVLKYLKAGEDVRLLVMDLLFEQPEDETVIPLGIAYLERIRKHFPDLQTVTRSIVSKPSMFGPLFQQFVRLGIRDHFLAFDPHPYSALRRRVLVETLRQGGAPLPSARQLRQHIGDHWCVVLFADISGFTTMTEQLWQGDKAALCDALTAFYDLCIGVVHLRGGVVDKFIGDELMALFIEDGRKSKNEIADAAIAAAIELSTRFKDLARRFEEVALANPDSWTEVVWKLKAGLEAGDVRVLAKGLGPEDTEYCSIGHVVNIASRIKGVGGEFGISVGPNLKRFVTHRYTLNESSERLTFKNVSRKIPVYTVAY